MTVICPTTVSTYKTLRKRHSQINNHWGKNLSDLSESGRVELRNGWPDLLSWTAHQSISPILGTPAVVLYSSNKIALVISGLIHLIFTQCKRNSLTVLSDTLPSLPPGFWKLNWGLVSSSRSTKRTLRVFCTGTSKNSIVYRSTSSGT